MKPISYGSKKVRDELGLVTAGEVSIIYGIDEAGIRARIRKGTFPAPDIEYYQQTSRARYCRRFWYKDNLPKTFEVRTRVYKIDRDDFVQKAIVIEPKVREVLKLTQRFFGVLDGRTN